MLRNDKNLKMSLFSIIKPVSISTGNCIYSNILQFIINITESELSSGLELLDTMCSESVCYVFWSKTLVALCDTPHEQTLLKNLRFLIWIVFRLFPVLKSFTVVTLRMTPTFMCTLSCPFVTQQWSCRMWLSLLGIASLFLLLFCFPATVFLD